MANINIEEDLFAAITRGDVTEVARLIDAGAHIDQGKTDFPYDTALTSAVRYNHTDIVRLLLDKGADMNKAGGSGETALTAAVRYNHTDIVSLLLDKGADLNKAGGSSATPLTAAVKNNHTDIVSLLLDKGADLNKAGGTGPTPLTAAVKNNHTDIVRLLLDKGADVNKADGSSATPLNTAARNSNTDIVRLLLDEGADVNKADGSGVTPLHCVVRSGDLETLKLLLSSGADINMQTDTSWTALHAAVEPGADLEIVKLLLSNGADISSRTDTGRTALHNAVEYGKDLEKVKLLLSNGADINMQTDAGKTAAMIAEAKHLTEISNYLRGAEDALKFSQHTKSTRKGSKEPNQREAASHSVALTAEGESSTQSQHTRPSVMNTDQHITNTDTLLDENKVEVHRHILENLEILSSKKTHRLNRAEKAIEKRDSRLNELESQVSNHQRDIQEKECEITKLRDRLDTLVDTLGETRRNSSHSQEVENLSHVTREIQNISKQMTTVTSQHLMLSNQFHQTGRALSQQMQQHHAESTMQQVQVKEEIKTGNERLTSTIHLDSGRAAAINVNCKNPKFKKHQKDIEMHMEPDSELLDQFFMQGIINPDDRRVIESESEILGKRKRILRFMDRDEECMSIDVKYRKVVRSLKECSDTGTNYALGQIMEKDV